MTVNGPVMMPPIDHAPWLMANARDCCWESGV